MLAVTVSEQIARIKQTIKSNNEKKPKGRFLRITALIETTLKPPNRVRTANKGTRYIPKLPKVPKSMGTSDKALALKVFITAFMGSMNFK